MVSRVFCIPAWLVAVEKSALGWRASILFTPLIAMELLVPLSLALPWARTRLFGCIRRWLRALRCRYAVLQRLALNFFAVGIRVWPNLGSGLLWLVAA